MAGFHNWTGDEKIDTQVPQFLNEDNAATQEKFNSILLPNGQLSTPSGNDAYLCKVAADALSSINDITQMTIEQSADGKIWETVFDSDSTSASIKQAYLYGLQLPKTITIPPGYMARVTLATYTTTYFSNISLFLVARSPSADTLSYKCSVGFNELQYVAVQGTISTWGSWAASLFDRVGYNIVQYTFNEDKKADSSLSFMGMQCKGTNPFRNVLRFDAAKQITTTPFGIQAPTFNGYTIGASVPANAKFTDTVYTHPATHPASMITGLATVATSGSYNDLTDKPNIPASAIVDSELSSTSVNPVQNKAIYNALLNKVGTDIFSGFALMGATSTITWRQGSNPIGSINATNYTGTAARATQDGEGNVITETYAKRGTANTWGKTQTFEKAICKEVTIAKEIYGVSYTGGGAITLATNVVHHVANSEVTLDMAQAITDFLSVDATSTVFSIYITTLDDSAAYPLIITNAGTLKYVGSASDLAITGAGMLLNIMMLKDSSGNITSIVQASKLEGGA